MASKEKLGSVKRFGARYGRKTKEKFAKIEKEQRKLHKCPYCNHVKVKRIAVGIWNCRKCNAKFAGKAYSVRKKIIAKEELLETKKEKEEAEVA
jgi:large subunit ribosomal protein L37Ae